MTRPELKSGHASRAALCLHRCQAALRLLRKSIEPSQKDADGGRIKIAAPNSCKIGLFRMRVSSAHKPADVLGLHSSCAYRMRGRYFVEFGFASPFNATCRPQHDRLRYGWLTLVLRLERPGGATSTGRRRVSRICAEVQSTPLRGWRALQALADTAAVVDRRGGRRIDRILREHQTFQRNAVRKLEANFTQRHLAA